MLGHDLFNFIKTEHPNDFVVGTTMNDLNCLDLNAVEDFLDKNEFDVLMNCTAFTNTIACETNEGMLLSYKLNVLLPKTLAGICLKKRIKLIHVSTDYVFSEYSPSDENNNKIEFPINTYGLHKLLGEKEIFAEMKYADPKISPVIIRTSWLYGQHNKKSFIHKFVKNIRNTGTAVCVDDQFSVPTSTDYLSKCMYDVINKTFVPSIISGVPSHDGPVSKYEFASEIIKHIPDLKDMDITHVKTVCTEQMAWPKDSTMGHYEFFDKRNWKECLKDFMNFEFKE